MRGEDKGSTTKEQILEAALDLFSIRGYEATSISQIAEAVGIRKASLYSHFSSKQEILDTLVNNITEEYDSHSIFGEMKTDAPVLPITEKGVNLDALTTQVLEQIRYSIHDPHISKVRKMLIVEQFQNETLARIQTKQSYADITDFFKAIFARMREIGLVIDADPEIMAVQYSTPITIWMNLCDREPWREEEAMGLIEKHIKQFYGLYLNADKLRSSLR